MSDTTIFRYYKLQHTIEDAFTTMSLPKMEGVFMVLSELHHFLDKIHFEDKRELNRRAFVKTIADLYENCMEDLIHLRAGDTIVSRTK